MGIGLGALVMAMMQSYSFNYMGQKLALRVRLLMFAALLRQVGCWVGRDLWVRTHQRRLPSSAPVCMPHSPATLQ